jgi:hypothetical protein
MNIPLEPTRPLIGIASPEAGVDPPKQEEAPKQPKRRYIPRVLSPARMWALIRNVVMITKADPEVVAHGIVPQMKVGVRLVKAIDFTASPATVITVGYVGGRTVGFPGSGIFRGRQNIAKTLTYRATGVPGGFNAERNAMRAAATKAAQEWLELQAIAESTDAGN